MAEVATGVLHNVGNVLNSVNVASTCLADSLRKSKSANLSKVVALLQEHEADLGPFLTSDSKGKQLPGYLAQLAEHLAGEQTAALHELAQLQKNIEHIKDIVTMQQSFAKVSGVTETLPVTDLVEDALRMNSSSLLRHDIQVIREFEPVAPIMVEKHKVLQILVNLVRNARHACEDSGHQQKRLLLRVINGHDHVRIAVTDNGVGIPPENLTRIFAHGFTTKKDGHGFGLHSGALAAREMGGSLSVQSEGTGRGATFTLELPLHPAGRNIAPITAPPQLAA
jgi:signal transduction histidine kinase